MHRVFFITSETTSALLPEFSRRFLFNTSQRIHVMRPKQPLQKVVCVCVYLPVCVHTHTPCGCTYVRKMLYIHKGKKSTCINSINIWVCVHTQT